MTTRNRRSGVALRWLWWAVVGVVSVIVFSTIASVNTFPVATNDSLVYLGHSSDYSEYGLVTVGYRQFGYPVHLTISRAVADILAIEPLLFVSLVQRALLVAGIILSIVLWTWASAGLLVFLLAASTLAYPNLILTEGLSLPLAVLLGIAFMALTAKRKTWEATGRWRLWAASGTVVFLAVWLFAIRFPFAVFGVVPAGVALIFWKSTFRRPALALLAVYLASVALVSVALSVENADEYGEFFPTVRGERSAYWATWSLVFDVYTENRDDPRLAEFFDDGNPYRFINEVERSGLAPDEQRTIFRAAIDDLVVSAGLPPRWSQVESALWSLRGGRLDDLERRTGLITSSTRHNVDEVIYQNWVARDQGSEAFNEQFNNGHEPEALLTSAAAPRFPLPDGREASSILLPISLLVLLIGLTQRTSRIEALVGLLVVLAYAGAIGVIRADNYRFLITTTAFGLVIATGVGHRLIEILRVRIPESHGRLPDSSGP